MAIGFHCITSAKYDQMATLLRQGYDASIPATYDEETIERKAGEFVIKKHPITGEAIRIWEPVTIPGDPREDDPHTDVDESLMEFRFPCQARPIITGGLNSQGTTERWTSKGDYENIEFIEIQIPKNVIVTKRDRITNITDSRGNYIWREEEGGSFEPTVFDVRGVAPSLDPFGSVVEYFALLERSQVQSREGNHA